jgi:hypothetical protein
MPAWVTSRDADLYGYLNGMFRPSCYLETASEPIERFDWTKELHCR